MMIKISVHVLVEMQVCGLFLLLKIKRIMEGAKNVLKTKFADVRKEEKSSAPAGQSHFPSENKED